MLMLFCAIVRLCGGLWFTADTSIIKEPSKFWQDVIMAGLFAFETTIVFKILCKTKWIYCFLISCCELLLFDIFKNQLISNIISIVSYYVVAFCFQRKWIVLIETTIIYLIGFIYSALFLMGRIGFVNGTQGYNFIFSVLGSIDYKLFIVSIYLFLKNFGGVKLWKWKILVL
jgi:hypothetical protein